VAAPVRPRRISVFRRSIRDGDGTGGAPDGPPGGAADWDRAGLTEGLLGRAADSFRRWMIAGTAVAVVLLGGISIALAWRQYDAAKGRALTDLEARVVGVAAVVDTSFAGQISTLEAIAAAPSVVGEKTARMDAYFARANAHDALFSGGLGWIDLNGHARATSNSNPGGASRASLSARVYFRRVLATGKPYVSAGIIGRRLKVPIIVVAVPTRGPKGRVSGVLVGSVVLKTVAESQQALDLGYGDLQIIDRNGNLLLSGLSPVADKGLLTRIERQGSGVLSGTPGLDGRGSDVVAFATSTVPGWVTAIDRPRSTVFAAAQRALALELASVGAGILLVFVILGFVVRRSRRETEAQNERARSWGGLTQALTSAATPLEVADALLTSLAAAFADAVVIVAFESLDILRVKTASGAPQARRIVESRAALDTFAQLGNGRPSSQLLEHEPALSGLHAQSGRRFKALHSLPILDKGEPVGTISLLAVAARLGPSDWSLLWSSANQAAHALERARLFSHEHELAVRLQRSLLPARLPSSRGLELAGHYLAGGDAVEVGGDWYDAVRRPDGIVQLCVGDVSGKGIGAATVMGRQRNTFHVYAHDYVSPAEIVRRMLRHIDGDEMITLACISLDPYTGELAYSCAGHPPPLLLDQETGELMRLDRASSPPLGVADPADIIEARVQLSQHAALAMYTDGLIERRGENIDHGIDLLGQVIATETNLAPDRVVSRVSEAIGAPDDDVALMLVTFDGERTGFEIEVPARADSLSGVRRRLRAWLSRRPLDEQQIDDALLAVSEACNNAIEHAYREVEGPINLSIRDEADTLRIIVEDSGSWREERPSDERGRGITLMRQLTHSAEIETSERGTRVTLALRLRPVQATLHVAPTT